MVELSPDTARLRLAYEREHGRALSMLRPLPTEEAYRRFGTFLGLLPPLALFWRISGEAVIDALRGGSAAGNLPHWTLLLLLLMNVVCCLVGRKLGGFIGRRLGDPRSRSATASLFVALLHGLCWGVVTGAAGGAPAFLLGAVVGVFVAVPVALAAFPVFALLLRLLSHGGMIEARQVWPLAFGVPLTAAALILGHWLT